MLLLASTLLSSALAGPFSPADEDQDGVPDRRDGCLALPETVNGYADDDGCPDHLAVLDVIATIGTTPVPATVTLTGATRTVVTAASRAATDLVPHETLHVRAEALCWVGTTTLEVAQGRNALVVPLTPRFDQVLDLELTAADGTPLHDATLQFDSPCAPRQPLHLADGRGRIRVGEGSHTMRIVAPGHAPETLVVNPMDGRVAVTLHRDAPLESNDGIADGEAMADVRVSEGS